MFCYAYHITRVVVELKQFIVQPLSQSLAAILKVEKALATRLFTLRAFKQLKLAAISLKARLLSCLTNRRQFLRVCPVFDHESRHHIVKVGTGDSRVGLYT